MVKSWRARDRVTILSPATAALWAAMLMVAVPGIARAQSASKVIEKYVTAIGGKRAVEKTVSTDVSGTVTSADGRSGVFTLRTARPRLYYVSMSWGDSRWSAGFNGRAAWQDDNIDGVRTLYGAPASRIRAEATFAATHLLMPEKLTQMSVTGQDQLRGRRVVVMVAISADGMKRTLSFDAESSLLVKDEQQTDDGPEERFFEDYRPVDQVLEPHRIEWRRNGETFRIAVQRITRNSPGDGRVFDAPVRTAEPPLDLDVVLSAAGRNEQRADDLRTSYAYVQTATHGSVDPQGQVAPIEGRTYEVFHLGGRAVARLLKKEGGEALSEDEQRREDERVTTIVRDFERRRLSGQPPVQPPRASSGFVIVWSPVWGVDWLSAYRRMSEFSQLRRERLQGRAVLVVEFQPKHGASSKSDFEQQIGNVAGTLWIDEASQYVIRLESYFVDEFNRNVEGSSLRVERTLVNEEIWLPARYEMNLRRSYPFGHLSHDIGTVEYRDYKKFTVDTDVKVTLPDAGR